MDVTIFDGVRYYIHEKLVKNPAEVRHCTCASKIEFPFHHDTFLIQVKQILKRGGASREFYISELVTHVISDEPVSSSDETSQDLQKHDHVIVNVRSHG